MTKWYVIFSLLCFLAADALQAQSLKSRQNPFGTPALLQGQRSFSYDLETLNAGYQELQAPFVSLNEGEIWDDPNYVIDIPFDFEFSGKKLVRLVTAGLGGALVGYYEDPLDPEVVYLSPFDVDLMDRGNLGTVSLSPIRMKQDVIGGNQVLIVEWQNAGFYNEWDELGTMDMFVNFQARFFEGTNVIEFHFGTSDITNPALIYEGESGAYIGFANFNLESGDVSDFHLLEGPAANPTLTSEDATITGTPPSGTIYRFTPTDPSSIQENNALGLTLWPNPATDLLLLHTEGRMVEQATIFSVAGQPLWTAQHLAGDPLIPVAHLAPGTYFLQVRTERGSETFQWVKL